MTQADKPTIVVADFHEDRWDKLNSRNIPGFRVVAKWSELTNQLDYARGLRLAFLHVHNSELMRPASHYEWRGNSLPAWYAIAREVISAGGRAVMYTGLPLIAGLDESVAALREEGFHLHHHFAVREGVKDAWINTMVDWSQVARLESLSSGFQVDQLLLDHTDGDEKLAAISILCQGYLHAVDHGVVAGAGESGGPQQDVQDPAWWTAVIQGTEADRQEIHRIWRHEGSDVNAVLNLLTEINQKRQIERGVVEAALNALRQRYEKDGPA